MSTDSPEPERCFATCGNGIRCELPDRHNSPHENNEGGGRLTWEPAYVGDLRRALDDARRALGSVAQ